MELESNSKNVLGNFYYISNTEKMIFNAGEAVYVDDIPAPKDCLYGAFLYSTKPLARVKGITFKNYMASKKVVTVISANDIPKGGRNVGVEYIFGSESLFAESLTEFAGQPLGVVVIKSL